MRQSGWVEFGATFREAGVEWLHERCLLHGGALAFGAVFALAPLFVIAITIAGHLAEHGAFERLVIAQLQKSFGTQAGTALQVMIDASRHNAEAGGLASPVAWAILVGTVAGVCLTMQDSLNLIWHVQPKRGALWHQALRRQTIGMAIAFCVGLVGIAAFTLVAVVIVALSESGVAAETGRISHLQLLIALASFAIITPLIAIIFRFLPNARVDWRDIWAGAAMAAALLLAGQWLIARYLSEARMANSYGSAAASFLALMVWIFMSALVFYFGAVFTRVSEKRRRERHDLR
jgi:membrane protein